MQLRKKRGYRARELAIRGADGSGFSLVVCQSGYNCLDFSVILTVLTPGSSQLFRLRRYNGKSHEHTNTIEGDRFYEFHVHAAAERYQDRGDREDAYAEPCGKFTDLEGFLRRMFDGCAFELPYDPQLLLFEV